MKKPNTTQKFVTLAVAVFLIIFSTLVVVQAIDPESPDAVNVTASRTASYPTGDVLNYSRAYIHVANISHAQPTLKWVGYVGNISGTIALKDSSAYKLFDWSTSTISGELYATKEASASGQFNGGIPEWANVICANQSMINDEGKIYNHTVTDGDAYNQTFKTSGFTLGEFYAGETLLNDTLVAGPLGSSAGRECHGINLYVSSSRPAESGTADWAEVVLTDLTFEDEDGDSDWGPRFQYDLIYAGILENATVGYDGGEYDFQLMLPQSGLEGSQSTVAFYFYIELV